MRVIDAGNTGILCLGYAGENDRTVVRFPFGDIKAEYPGGVVILRIRRPWDTDHHDVMPEIDQDGVTAIWTVSDYDLETMGEGECQLIYSNGTVIAKRKVWKTKVDRSIDGVNASIPPNWEDIEEALVRAAGEVIAAIEQAARPTDEQVAQAVSEWLEDHPEATTTVEDGSITLTKLNQSIIDDEPVEDSGNLITSGAVYDALEDIQDKLVFDDVPTAGSDNPVKSNGIKTALDAKQNTLTFDDTPMASSNNPVKSNGIKTALDAKQDTLTFDDTPTASSDNPVKSNGIKTALDAKQNTLTFDSTPTTSSTNPVTSGGIKAAIDAVSTTINNRVPAPSAAGKFLQTDINGDPEWGDAASVADVVSAVEDWLEDNMPAGETVAIDTSLLVSGAAADSKTVGDALSLQDEEIDNLKSEIDSIEDVLEGFYITETQEGAFFSFSESDDYLYVQPDSNVIKGTRNVIDFGSSLEVGTTYTKLGISYVKQANGSITLSGTASAKADIILFDGTGLPSGMYTLSGCPDQISGDDITFVADYWLDNKRTAYLRDTGTGDHGELPSGYTRLYILISIPKDTEVNGTLYPQFERGTTPTEYVKCANETVPENSKIEISDGMTLFSSSSFTLTLVENASGTVLGRLDTIENNITEITETYPSVKSGNQKHITINDGADGISVKSMIVETGYTASGLSKETVIVSNKNMFNLDDVITKGFITKNTDGSLTPSGTVSIYSGKRSASSSIELEDIPRVLYLPAGEYYISKAQGAFPYLTSINPTTGEYIEAINVNGNTGKFSINSAKYINVIISETTAGIMISSSQESEYAKDDGSRYTVQFIEGETPFSMYGGTVDFINGIVTELYDSSGEELSTPVVHNVQPVDVKTVLGFNHIWTKGENVQTEYHADIKMYVDQRNKSEMLDKYNIDASIFGNVRNEMLLLPGAHVISVAHRGLSFSYPENTLIAYKAAKQAGFLVAETDVDWTSDGVPVLLHDPSINRTARNPDGTEIEETIWIRDITYAQALEYDFGIRDGEQFAGTKIPTFEEFIALCKKLGIIPIIELKFLNQTPEQTRSLVDIVIKYGMINRVAWTSNFARLLLQVLDIHQGANINYIVMDFSDSKWAEIYEMREKYPAINLNISCSASTITEAQINTLKAMNLPLGLGTYDTESAIINMPEYCSAVTSNRLVASDVLRNSVLND